MPAKSKPRLHWIIPMVMWAFLLATAVFSKPFSYSAGHLAMLAGLYLMVALLLYLPVLPAARRGTPAVAVVVAVSAFLLALHYREQTRPSGTAESLDKPAVLASFLLGWLAVALLLFAALRLLRARDAEAPARITLLAVAPLLLGCLMLGFYGSNTLRWHLLRHNILLGALCHHLFDRDTVAVRADLWERHAADPQADVPPAADLLAAEDAATPPDAVEAANQLPTEPAPQRLPNIVFVLIDTLRVDALAATGGPGGLMPYVDRLADESWSFTDVKANASWTFPSMASFFTGRLPEEHGAVGQSTLGAAQLTLAEVLAARGYRTAAFVANGAWMRADRGMAQGFDEFHQLAAGGAVYPRAEEVNAAVFEWLDQGGREDGAGGPPEASGDPSPSAGTFAPAAAVPTGAADSAPPGAAAAADSVRAGAAAAADGAPANAAAAAPLFLYVHYMDPHVPYLSAGVVDPASHRQARAAYDRDLRYLDARIGELMAGLTERLETPAWTLLAADHGEEFGEHGERGHGRALYDEVLRVPALLHDGDSARSGVIGDKLEGRDFFSLLLALSAGEALDVQGWAHAHARSERYASTYYTNSSLLYRLLRPYRSAVALQAIERDGYTLIWSGQGDTYELYDMGTDAAQRHNIADRRPDVLGRLAAAMRAAPAYWTPEIRGTLDAAARERLRSLGYLR